MKSFFIALLAILLYCGSGFAAPNEESETGLELPRMVSLRSSLIKARSGPANRYPIEWV